MEIPERAKERESWPMRFRGRRVGRVSVLEWGRVVDDGSAKVLQ